MEQLRNAARSPEDINTNGDGNGRGFGLSISHNILEHYGGHMEIDSKKNEGTHFDVHSLPARRTEIAMISGKKNDRVRRAEYR